MKRFLTLSLPLSAAMVFAIACGNDATTTAAPTKDSAKTAATDSGNEKDKAPVSNDVQLQLPKGFVAIEVTPGIGPARHLVVNSNGDIYVKMANANRGRCIMVLRDKNGDGIADETSGFGNYEGTGIAIKNGYLYASSNTEVYRYKLNSNNQVADPGKPETIITGLLDKGEHNSKSIALDDAGNIYVNVGAPSNACQVQNRKKGSPGQDPCPLLATAGGIWQFRVDKLNQSYAQGVRYITGIRNIVGLDWNKDQKELYLMQHGRDQLHELFPECCWQKRVQTLAGPIAILMNSKTRRCCLPNLVEMARSKAAAHTCRHLLLPFQATGRQMPCCSIQEHNFRSGIAMAHLLRFMDHGTGRLNHRLATR
jgi:glucose/arabinose dehydrogenase